jgi:hypothetical protein
MHVLVTEAHFGDGDRLVGALRAIGVQVTRCHDRVGYCRALRPGDHCPLDREPLYREPVDFVVDVRGAGTELTAREYGAVCAVRAQRPVWVVPAHPSMPAQVPLALRDQAVLATEEELLTMCQRVGHAAAAARLSR